MHCDVVEFDVCVVFGNRKECLRSVRLHVPMSSKFKYSQLNVSREHAERLQTKKYFRMHCFSSKPLGD